jgi:hypothetical protein
VRSSAYFSGGEGVTQNRVKFGSGLYNYGAMTHTGQVLEILGQNCDSGGQDTQPTALGDATDATTRWALATETTVCYLVEQAGL